jgi:SOS-response transcriptional repressor LexA
MSRKPNIFAYQKSDGTSASATVPSQEAEHIHILKELLQNLFGIIGRFNIFIFRMVGDSMLPTLPKTCTLIEKKGDIINGQICLVCITDMYVKRI